MSLQWLTCDNGEKMWVKKLNDYRITGEKVQIEGMVDVPLRSDDIMVISYRKTGCHWVWENMRMLLSGSIIKDTIEKDQTILEFKSREVLDKLPSPRILNSHCFFNELPTDLLKGETKVVLTYRNPKDVCVSLYHHFSKLREYKYDGEFNNFMIRFAKGNLPGNSYFDQLKSWEEGFKKHPNIKYHLVMYEEFHRNPISERRRLASFLGRECDDDFLQQVMEATTIDNMRNLKGDNRLDTKGQSIYYRKGKVGDWKDYFTVSQSEWFDDIVEKEMKDSKLFEFVYSLD